MSATPAPGTPTSEPQLAAPAAEPAPAAPKILCANCGLELFGPHCYSCGQPVKGMVRHLSSILGDIADTILNIDSRIFRTLFPLYFRPGFLSVEYFAGRRVRYVTPFRLYFFLSVAAFLLIQTSLDSFDMSRVVQIDSDDKIAAALTPQEVVSRRDEALTELAAGQKEVDLPKKVTKHLDEAQERIREAADKRLDYLKSVEEAKAVGAPPPPNLPKGSITIKGIPWDPRTNPVHFNWLPDFVNDRLNRAMVRATENMERVGTDPKPLLLGAFSVLPQVLFVLMPLFALLLKIFYIFKRRLYMEHLIVALHSHSFIFISLLLMTIVGLIRGWSQTEAPALHQLLTWVLWVMGSWMPVYLFLMQKKVYRQGWFFTTIKFGMIGICYTILVSWGIAAAFLISLATT
jgi:hypothetical protein